MTQIVNTLVQTTVTVTQLDVVVTKTGSIQVTGAPGSARP
jgi:hypothetical protein